MFTVLMPAEEILGVSESYCRTEEEPRIRKVRKISLFSFAEN